MIYENDPRSKNWRSAAACKGMDPALFFPEERFKPGSEEYEEELALIKNLCDTCPVREQCLELSNQHPDDQIYGIWAGLTPEERKAEREI